MRETQWFNNATREAYFHFLETVDDPLDFARGWIDMHGVTALPQLVRRLRRDSKALVYGEWSDHLAEAFVRAGLRLVAWPQVAARILERAGAVDAKPATGQDEGDGGTFVR
jgi:hypothetical protein